MPKPTCRFLYLLWDWGVEVAGFHVSNVCLKSPVSWFKHGCCSPTMEVWQKLSSHTYQPLENTPTTVTTFNPAKPSPRNCLAQAQLHNAVNTYTATGTAKVKNFQNKIFTLFHIFDSYMKIKKRTSKHTKSFITSVNQANRVKQSNLSQSW